MCSDHVPSRDCVYTDDNAPNRYAMFYKGDERILLAQADPEFDSPEDFHNDQKAFDNDSAVMDSGSTDRIGSAPTIRYYTENEFHWKRWHPDYSYKYEGGSGYFKTVPTTKRYQPDTNDIVLNNVMNTLTLVFFVFIFLFMLFKQKKS